MIRISELKVNIYARVIKVDIPNTLIKRHVMEMGLTRNTKIRIVNIAPMGDPISIELRGYELAIRKSDAYHIWVEVLS